RPSTNRSRAERSAGEKPASTIQALERVAVIAFRLAETRARRVESRCAMLKSPLREHRHVDPRDGFHASPDDLAFQRVQGWHVVAGQGSERNRLRNLDDVRSRIGTAHRAGVT